MSDEQQSFANHSRMVPGYHYVAGTLVIGAVVWSAVRVVREPNGDTILLLVVTLGLFLTAWFTRTFPVRVQDRLIRLEERLRMARLLPADLQSRIDEFTPRQMVALRFASDAELPELARKVLTEKIVHPKAIKAMIKVWRADNYRV